MRHSLVTGVSPLLLLVLAACGGDGAVTSPTSVVSPTPAPSPTPTPPPTPAPTPIAGVPEGCPAPDFTSTLRYDVAEARFAQYIQSAQTSNVAPVDPARNNNFTFNAANKSYSYKAVDDPSTPAIERSATWLPSDIEASRSDARFTVFRKECDSAQTKYIYELTLFNQGSSNDLLTLAYAGFGRYYLSELSKLDGDVIVRALAYGTITPPAALSRTGTSVYNGVIRATAVAGASPTSGMNTTDIDGTIQLFVDFVAKSYSGSMTLRTRPSDNTAPVQLGTFPITQASGTGLEALVGTTSNGKLAGFFAGPAAEEAAINFRIDLQTPNPLNASVIMVGSGAAKR